MANVYAYSAAIETKLSSPEGLAIFSMVASSCFS